MTVWLKFKGKLKGKLNFIKIRISWQERCLPTSVIINDTPGKEPADYKELNESHEELSWNIECLELPEFDNEYICFAMHKFFADGSYSLEDAMRMKPEDFHIFTEIHI